ncbi:MAG: hypothetical protein V3U92_07870 [Cellulophaga sp.]
MDTQDIKFNFKIILAALIAVIIGILIAFYFSYAQSNNQISFLEQEKDLLVNQLTLMQAEVDYLSAENEVSNIELQSSKYRIDQLIDSVGRLQFTIKKLRAYKRELRKLETKHESIRLRNNTLRSSNKLLSRKFENSKREIIEIKGTSSSLAKAEALLRERNRELRKELKSKSYLRMQTSEGVGFRLRPNGKPIKTNKASTIEMLRGCVVILENTSIKREDKIIYFQFLGPNKNIIEDNANTINVNGNTYSRKVEFIFTGDEIKICDFITVPSQSLKGGIYTLNVFEDEKLLSSTEFVLK